MTLKDGVLRQNGYRRETQVAAAADAALDVAKAIHGLDASLVHAAICLTRSELPDLGGWARDVAVTATANVLNMLLTAPVVLSAVQVAALAMHMDVTLGSAVPVSSGAPQWQPMAVASASIPEPVAVPKASLLRRMFG